ncbi:MAG: hypothetical protein ACYDD2_01910, partial [Candidatus Acidiferrales bacterium]
QGLAGRRKGISKRPGFERVKKRGGFHVAAKTVCGKSALGFHFCRCEPTAVYETSRKIQIPPRVCSSE